MVIRQGTFTYGELDADLAVRTAGGTAELEGPDPV